MNTNLINVDYIGVVSNTNNIVEYQHIPIDKKYKYLLDKIKKDLDNTNCNVLDLQTEFKNEFPITYSAFEYCYPEEYYSKYNSHMKRYPKILTPFEYEEKIKELCKGDTASDLRRYYDNVLKKNFICQCEDFLNAFHYYNTLSKIIYIPSIKIYSNEACDYHVYEYKINDDIIFYISTSFEYHYDSDPYFYVNLKYKNINILPYSEIIRYYHANMVDIIRHTRSYFPDRPSWDDALQFIADLANQAISNEESFIKEWVLTEAKKMLCGLENIKNNLEQAYSNITNRTNTIGNLTLYRNITNHEKEIYSAYPEESRLVFQAEKISGALYFLNNLQQLSTIYSELNQIITRIKELNRSILPDILHKITQIQNENNLISNLNIQNNETLKTLCIRNNFITILNKCADLINTYAMSA